MKQFLYMDTDIVNSIIAQAEKGLVTQHSSQSADEEKEKNNHQKMVSGGAGGSGSIFKIVQAQAELKGDISLANSRESVSSSKDIIERILHDASFDIAYNYINLKNVACDSHEYDEVGNYLVIKREYSFVDLKYLEKLFSKDGVIEYLKKTEAEKIEAAAEQAKEGYSREELRKAGVNFRKEVQNAISVSNRQYDEIGAMINMIRSFIPYDRLLISDDGYLVPLEEKYFRVDPTNLGFRYGGEITCVGMVTNIVETSANQNEPANVFALLQHTVNDVLRNILPTINNNLCVIHPIAVYYGD